MTTRAAIYCRISRDRVGAGLGIDRQRADCLQLAESLGWVVVATHEDNDLSAYSGKPRPGYLRLLDAIRTGTVNAVLAWHTDRLHRSPVELEDYITACEARGVPTHCVKAGPLDLATPSGRLVARQLGAVARYEVEHMTERQRAAKLQAKLNGQWCGGRRPFGYERGGVTVRPDEAAELLSATERVLAGESLNAIARDWNARGIKTSMGGEWTQPSVRDVIGRPRNAGLVEHLGQIVAVAEWPAIVPEGTWRAVRAMLDDPNRGIRNSTDRRWLGSGIYLCGVCGDVMRSGTTPSTRGAGSKPSYRCRAGAHLSRVAEPVDKMVEELIVERLSQPDAVDLLDDGKEDIAPLHTELATVRARLDELGLLYAKDIIDARQLATGTGELKARSAALEERIAAASSGSVLAGIVGADDVRAAWDAASIGRRRASLQSLMRVTLLKAARGRQPGGVYFNPDYVDIRRLR